MPKLGTKHLVVGGIAAALVALDQLAKIAVVRFFNGEVGSSRTVIPGLFDLVLEKNPGAAWSMGRHIEPAALRIGIFVTVSVLAIGLVGWLVHRAKDGQRLLLAGLSLVLGGALGNLVDRVLQGEVVDFLEFYSRAGWMVSALNCHPGRGCMFPAFNVADSCISVGVAILLLDGFLSSRKAAPTPSAIV